MTAPITVVKNYYLLKKSIQNASAFSIIGKQYVMSFTQENAIDLHSLTLATTAGEKHADPLQNISLYPCTTFPLVAIC